MREQHYVDSESQVRDWLDRYGYLDVARPKEATMLAQQFAGLKPDGWAGPITRGMMSAERCGCADFGPRANLLDEASWPQGCRLTLEAFCDFSGLSSSTLSRAAMESIWHAGFAETARVCNVSVRQASSKSGADMYAFAQRTSSGVLAWAEYPQNCSTQSQSAFGTQWNWTQALLEDTALHEQGHQFGLPHLPRGNVMYYAIDREYGQKWQAGDIAALLERYGDPKPPDDPKPPEDPDMPDWQQLFEILSNILRDCIEGSSVASVHRTIRRRGIIARVQLRRALLDAGVNRGDLSAIVDEIFADVDSMPESQLVDFLERLKRGEAL